MSSFVLRVSLGSELSQQRSNFDRSFDKKIRVSCGHCREYDMFELILYARPLTSFSILTAFADMLNEMRLGRMTPATIDKFKELTRALTITDGLRPTEL